MAEKTRKKVLEEFEILAYRHYDGDVPCSIKTLVATLAAHVPDSLAHDEPVNQVLLIGEIDSETACKIIDEMNDVHYYQPIELPLEILLSSSGGEVDGGTAIAATITEIRRLGRKVIIHVAGSAMSTAFDILQAADYRIAEPTALLMTHHEHFGMADSDAENVAREGKASIERAKLVFEQISKRTGRPAKYYLDKVRGVQWYITPDEALAEGLIDEISIPKPFPITPANSGKPTPVRKSRAKKTPAEETPNE